MAKDRDKKLTPEQRKEKIQQVANILADALPRFQYLDERLAQRNGESPQTEQDNT